jgi:phenylalanyl-tRNA synthetase beta subunit (EC 6.1.1.20)
MRVPLSWLREYVDVPADATPEDVLASLVSVGFEEEDVHGFELTGPIVVGRVVEFVDEPQSNGKTIRWCQVDVGRSTAAFAASSAARTTSSSATRSS